MGISTYQIGIGVQIDISQFQNSPSYLTEQLSQIDPGVKFKIVDHNEVLTYFDPNGIPFDLDTTKEKEVILKTEAAYLPQGIGFSLSSAPQYKYIYVPISYLNYDLTDTLTSQFVRKIDLKKTYLELTSDHALSGDFSSFSRLKNNIIKDCIQHDKELNINLILQHLMDIGKRSMSLEFFQTRSISGLRDMDQNDRISHTREYYRQVNDYIAYTFLNRYRYIECLLPIYIKDGKQKLLTKISAYSIEDKKVSYISEPILIHSHGRVYNYNRALVELTLNPTMQVSVFPFKGYPYPNNRMNKFPHVYSSGNMCYGSLKISRDLSSENIYNFLKVTAQGLYNYNIASPVHTPDGELYQKNGYFLNNKTEKSLIYPQEGELNKDIFSRLNIAMWQADCQQYDIANCSEEDVLEFLKNNESDYSKLNKSRKFDITIYDKEEISIKDTSVQMLPEQTCIPVNKFVFDKQNYYRYQENEFAYTKIGNTSICFILKTPIQYSYTKNVFVKISHFYIRYSNSKVQIIVKPILYTNPLNEEGNPPTILSQKNGYFHPLIITNRLILPYATRVKFAHLVMNMKLGHITTLIIDALKFPEKYSSHIDLYDEIIHTKFAESDFAEKN